MEATEPKVSLVPAVFQHPAVECFDLTFTGTHGARIYAKYLRPKNRPAKIPAVIRFHGYYGASSEWSEQMALASAGFAVAYMDARGQGGKSEDVGGVKGNTVQGHIIRGLDDPDPDRLLYRDILLDTAMLTRIVGSFPEVDENRIGAEGGSQAGGLTIACAALSNIKSAVFFYPFLSDYKRVWQLDLTKEAYGELTMYFRYFDPNHARENEIFTKRGYSDVQHLAPRIKANVHMCSGLMDTTCPPSTQFAAYNKIKSPKEVIFYPDFSHEWLPGYVDRMLQWFMQDLM